MHPPTGPQLLPPERMDRDARAQACWLAIQARWPIDPETWSYDPETRTVIVDVPGHGYTWGIIRGTADQILQRIDEVFQARPRAEAALG